MMKRKISSKNPFYKKEELSENGDLVYYAELLDRAHEDGLEEISTKLLQIPTKDNQFTAIVIARVCTNRGVFTGHGDASPTNVDPEIAPHIIRAAETRAKARALRDAVNVGTVAAEELNGDHSKGRGPKEKQVNVDGNGDPTKATNPVVTTEKQQTTDSQAQVETPPSDPPMTERQRSYLFRIMAQKGLEGDAAHEELKRAFRVNSLNEVSKTKASEIIQKLEEYFSDREGGGSC